MNEYISLTPVALFSTFQAASAQHINLETEGMTEEIKERSIKNWPVDDRPKEKLFKKGMEASE